MITNGKGVVVIAATSTTAAATATGTVDVLGFKAMELDVVLSAADGTTTSSKSTVLKLSESDDLTTYADVTGAVGGTSFTIPAAVTTTQIVAKFNVDLRGRKRYIKLSVSPGTTQTIYALANLTKAESMPDTAAEAGAGVLVAI